SKKNPRGERDRIGNCGTGSKVRRRDVRSLLRTVMNTRAVHASWQVETDGQIGRGRNLERNWIAEDYSVGWDHDRCVAAEGQGSIRSRNYRRPLGAKGEMYAADLHVRPTVRVGEAHAEGFAADARMHDLTDRLMSEFEPCGGHLPLACGQR